MSIPTSSIIAGTMNWGEWGKNFNTNEIQQLIATCLSENICAFDHADIMVAIQQKLLLETLGNK